MRFSTKIKNVCTGILLLLVPGTVFSQQGMKIEIQVTDAVTREPVGKATVKILPANRIVIMDDDGYRAVRLGPGQYQLTISAIGYQQRQCVMPVTDSVTRWNLPLVQNTTVLGDVLITGLSREEAEIRKVKQNVMPVTVIAGSEIMNRASSLNEILARQAGVQVRMTGGQGSAARISVRGLEGRRVQVYIDGNPLNSPDGSLGINDLPLQIIERIEIYKGTIPAWLGGDGLGSAVNVVLRHRNISYIDATVARQSYNTLNGGLILKKTWDKPGIELAGGAFWNSSDNNFVMESPYQPGLKIKRDHDKFQSLLTGGSVRFHKWWFDEIELEGAFVQIKKQIQGIQRNIQQAQTIGNTGVLVLGLTRNNLLNNKLSLKYHGVATNVNARFIDTSSYSYDWDGSHYPSLYGKGELGIGPDLAINKQRELRQQVNVNYLLNNVFTLNLNNTLRKGNYDPRDDVGNDFAGKNLYNYPGSLFNSITGLTLETRLNNGKWLFSTAAKHYYNKAKGYNTNIYLQTTPDKVNNVTNTFGYNAGMRYNFTHDFTFKTSFERAVRLPANAELFGDGALITPAISLKPEVAYNYTAGILYDRLKGKDNRVQLEGNAFYMQVSQMIQLAGSGLTTGYVNYAKVDVVGADAEVKTDLTKHLFVSANATWQRLRDVNKYIPGTAQVKNPTYKLQIPNVPEFFTNWSLEYHVDNLLAKGTRSRIIYEGSFVRQYYYAFNISLYDDYIIPSYVTHDITIEHSFKNERFTLSGEIHNLTNENVINNWNLPLPGRNYRIKLRCLLLGKKKSDPNNQ